MNEIKSKVEAILFCSPEGITTEKLAKVCGLGSLGHMKELIKSLAEEYLKRGAGVEITQQGTSWKIQVKNEYAELVKDAARPELSESVLETLAYIAWKGEPSQSSIIKARSNRAYNHLIELEAQGFIEKKKVKNSSYIKPTKKFFDYFQMQEGDRLELPKQ